MFAGCGSWIRLPCLPGSCLCQGRVTSEGQTVWKFTTESFHLKSELGFPERAPDHRLSFPGFRWFWGSRFQVTHTRGSADWVRVLPFVVEGSGWKVWHGGCHGSCYNTGRVGCCGAQQTVGFPLSSASFLGAAVVCSLLWSLPDFLVIPSSLSSHTKTRTRVWWALKSSSFHKDFLGLYTGSTLCLLLKSFQFLKYVPCTSPECMTKLGKSLINLFYTVTSAF